MSFFRYDKTGEGLHKDHSFFDKYGAPISIENFWMEGYHSMDRMLLQHMLRVGNDKIPFPSVAGYAGTAHLYKVGFKCVSIIRNFLFSDFVTC